MRRRHLLHKRPRENNKYFIQFNIIEYTLSEDVSKFRFPLKYVGSTFLLLIKSSGDLIIIFFN